jgi:hypothetical protein
LHTDSSAGRADCQEQIGQGVEALAAEAFVADVVLGPGQASNTGNVTGGRELARYDFGCRAILLPLVHPASKSLVRSHRRSRRDVVLFEEYADLTERRLLNGQRHNGLLEVLRDAILQHRLLAADRAALASSA